MVRWPVSTRSRRVLLLAACALPAWAAVVAVAGGIAWRTHGWSVSSRDPVRPLVGGAVAALIYWRWFSTSHLADDHEWLGRWSQKLAAPAVVALGAAVFWAGVMYGTFSASGSDAYGYVSQADLWLRGALHVSQPWTREMPWPLADWTFAPLGYRPATIPGAIVPTYPPGLPLMMAAFKAAFGPSGPFFVAPFCGALAVWLTFALGREATGEATSGATAALLLATSPAFVFQLMWPMSDVPVTAMWVLVFWLGLRPAGKMPLTAGLVASAALMVRPNLAPLALVLPAAWMWPTVQVVRMRSDAWRAGRRFGAGLVPGLIILGSINAHLFGSALASGYGEVGSLYSAANLVTNVRRYGAWLIETETPLIVFGLVAIGVPQVFGPADPNRRSYRFALTGGLIVVWSSYLLYAPFDDWWYLRFLLPAFPLMFVLTAAAFAWTWRKLPLPLRAPLAFVVLWGLPAYGLKFAAEHQAFALKAVEQRYEAAAREVVAATPRNAMILSMQHGGSLRYYAGRMTLRYDLLPPEWLDRALASLRAKGYHPYLVLDEWEEPAFRERFGQFSELAKLDRKPSAEVPGPIPVRVYDLDDGVSGVRRGP